MIRRLICALFGHDEVTDTVPDNQRHRWREPVPGEQVGHMQQKIGAITGRVLVRERICKRCEEVIPARQEPPRG